MKSSGGSAAFTPMISVLESRCCGSGPGGCGPEAPAAACRDRACTADGRDGPWAGKLDVVLHEHTVVKDGFARRTRQLSRCIKARAMKNDVISLPRVIERVDSSLEFREWIECNARRALRWCLHESVAVGKCDRREQGDCSGRRTRR